jgi:hypothetical protein
VVITCVAARAPVLLLAGCDHTHVADQFAVAELRADCEHESVKAGEGEGCAGGHVTGIIK